MLQKEFEERTGKTVTAEEFQNINSIYMMVKMDKDEFCKEWKKLGAAQRMVDELADYAKSCEEDIDQLRRQLAGLAQERDEDAWIGRAVERLQEWKKEVKHSFVNKECGSTTSDEDLFDAIRIVSTALSCKVQFNTPVRDNYSRTHDILILESNAAVVSKLHEAGFSLSMTDKGLSVTKY